MDKLDGKSLDLIKENINQLQNLFPEVVSEGKVDFDKLRVLLGGDEGIEEEQYELTWHGKRKALKLAQTPSTGTLRPDKETSKDWENTKNIYIEGDNLEVLKLLQKSYFGQVKLIYIDPPYNTGKDFVYEDDFRDNISNYKKITKQWTKANPETHGRYHTNWLNMMYPRLKLARNFLREDGVIFISIDDTELASLRKICDEIFGEENFLATVIWERAYAPVNLKKHFSESHDFIVVYAKNIQQAVCNGLKRDEEGLSRYKNPDNDPRGPWKAGDLSVGPVVPEKVYEITTPSGRKVLPPAGYCWRLTKERFEEYVKDNRIWFGEDGNNVPAIKRFLSEVKDTVTPMTIWKYEDVGHSQEAKQELKKLFDNRSYFDYPKPVKLIKRMLELYTLPDTEDIVMDFFSGSATTAHAVMEMNAEDGGNRRFILVQLPELTKENSDAYKDGYRTISEIGIERIRRAGERIQETTEHSVDTGFKVFRLDSSNIKAWDPHAEDLEGTLLDLLDNIKSDRTTEDVLYEIILKIGLPLTVPIAEISSQNGTFYKVDDGEVFVCLEDSIRLEFVQEMIQTIERGKKPKFIFKETGFPDDSTKTNIIQILKKHEIKDISCI